MHPLLTQIKTLVQTHYPDTRIAMSDDRRLEILHALLPLCPRIPHPASGDTLLRWQVLAYVAGQDLTLVKWLESHLDAISILHEIGYAKVYLQHPNKLWAVWAAEGHATPVTFTSDNTLLKDNTSQNNTIQGVCNGVKTWCSGANVVDFGLMTYRDGQNQSQLLVIDMKQHADTIHIDNSSWQAVGMQATDTATLTFSQTPTTQVGNNAYLTRAGFWHGGAGVAACWYGATLAIAEYLRISQQQKPNPFKAMYLGQISTQLAVTQQYFYYVARLIDNEPKNSLEPNLSHVLAIRQLRQQTEATARFVLEQVGQALGATPFCQNAHFARLSADLAVFIRQSHGAFDSQAIADLVNELVNDLGKNEQAHVWQL